MITKMQSGVRAVTAVLVALGLSAGAATADSFTKIDDRGEFMRLVENKTLKMRYLNIQLKVAGDGSIKGEGNNRPIFGTWNWRDGYFCRDITWGKNNIGPNCQEVAVRGDQMRFTSDRGQGQSARFRLR